MRHLKQVKAMRHLLQHTSVSNFENPLKTLINQYFQSKSALFSFWNKDRPLNSLLDYNYDNNNNNNHGR